MSRYQNLSYQSHVKGINCQEATSCSLGTVEVEPGGSAGILLVKKSASRCNEHNNEKRRPQCLNSCICVHLQYRLDGLRRGSLRLESRTDGRVGNERNTRSESDLRLRLEAIRNARASKYSAKNHRSEGCDHY